MRSLHQTIGGTYRLRSCSTDVDEFTCITPGNETKGTDGRGLTSVRDCCEEMPVSVTPDPGVAATKTALPNKTWGRLTCSLTVSPGSVRSLPCGHERPPCGRFDENGFLRYVLTD